MEITNEMIKKKRKEFIDEISAAINKQKGAGTGQFSPAIERLRQLAQLRKPTLEKPAGM